MKQIGELAKSLERKDDSLEQLVVARDEIVRLEHAVTHLQERELQTKRDHEAECHRLQHCIEACHNEIRLRVMESSAATKELETEQTRYEQLQKDVMSKDVSLKKWEQRCCLLESEKKKVEESIQNLKMKINTLQQQVESLSSQTKEMKQTASQARAEADKVSCFLALIAYIYTAALITAPSLDITIGQ